MALSSSSPSKDSNLELYATWREQLKVELKERSQINVDDRMQKVVTIVNDTLAAPSSFSVSDQAKLAMKQEIETKIDAWGGVDISLCKNKDKKVFKEYQATALNWFNRNKAKIYGNHLFYELIYSHVLKFCAEQPHLSESQRMIAFISIFELVLSATVQFPRAKLQPLLPHQTLMQPNRFKQACQRFAQYYQVQCSASGPATHSIRDPARAKKIHSSFFECLAKIRLLLEISPSEAPPLPFPFMLDETQNDAPTSTLDANQNDIGVSFGEMETCDEDIKEAAHFESENLDWRFESHRSLVTVPCTLSNMLSPPSLSAPPSLPPMPSVPMLPDISRIALPSIDAYGVNLWQQQQQPAPAPVPFPCNMPIATPMADNCGQQRMQTLTNEFGAQSMTMQYEAPPQFQLQHRPPQIPLPAFTYGPVRGVNHCLCVCRHRHCPMSNVPRTAPDWDIANSSNGLIVSAPPPPPLTFSCPPPAHHFYDAQSQPVPMAEFDEQPSTPFPWT